MIKKQNLHLPLLIIFSSLLVASFIISTASALAQEISTSTRTFSYPVTELGNCASKTECKNYCDNSANFSACLDFASRHGLMSEQKISRARNFISANTDTPGNCSTKDECRTYCSNANNLDECVAFAERHELMADKDLSEAKQIRDFVKAGGTLPGNCSTKDECRTYCSNANNLDECVAFAKQAGFADDSELESMSKIVPLIKAGETPGGCTSREDCSAYCSDSANRDECADFGKKIGVLDDDKVELYRRIGNTGPGNCSSPEECRTYCSNPNNQSSCLAFAEEKGVINSDQLTSIKNIASRFKNLADNAPASVAQCIQGVVGEEVLSKIKSGDFIPPTDMADKIKTCVSNNITEATKLRLEQRTKDNNEGETSQNEIRTRVRVEDANNQSIEIRNEAREKLKESLDSGTVDPGEIKNLEDRFFKDSNSKLLEKNSEKIELENRDRLEDSLKSDFVPEINLEKQRLELETKLRSSNSNTDSTVNSTR